MKIAPGDSVLTKYGAGVVVRVFSSPPHPPSEDRGGEGGQDDGDDDGGEWASVRLWRRPGESVGSCAIATLRAADCATRLLVASPGTIVRVAVVVSSESGSDGGGVAGDDGARSAEDGAPARLHVIERYLPSSDSYLARPLVDGDDGGGTAAGDRMPTSVVSLSPSQIASSSSRFYPMLIELIDRGEAAWTSAHLSGVAGELVRAVDAVASAIDGGGGPDDAMSIESSRGGAPAALGADAGGIVPPLPRAEEVRRVYDMLRDEDLSGLFLRGRERLKELVEEELPARAKHTLAGMGIELDDEDDGDGKDSPSSSVGGGAAGSMRRRMNRLRKEALTSLDEMMTRTRNAAGEAPPPDATTSSIAMAEEARMRFADAFDALSKAATSDPQLTTIFGSISDKTKTWQEMTGRLLQTRTASLFVEGAQRLTARAAEVLSGATTTTSTASGATTTTSTASSAHASGRRNADADADLTRAFTEGDVARAKLKSMEMGDAVRRRLFAAIELRSESSGGLDAIIAGSLARASSGAASLPGVGGLPPEEAIRSVVSDLRRNSTSAMRGTKESLIALLSRRSGHRDAALLRLERTLVDLESQLGHDLTPERIADIAGGEGGTMALFGPIAIRAAREIEVQLDAAESRMRESRHWNEGAGDVMTNVRRITRGELGIADLLDAAAGYLDDEDVVARSGDLIVRAESLLDTFEAASARLGGGGDAGRGGAGSAGAGIMDAVAKAGITKDAVLRGVEGLDMNKLLDDTQTAITDDKARRELISSAGDTALDFLLKILPSVPVPPFDGVREGLVYHLSNLSMAGFKVKKEDVCIEIAGMRAAAPQSSRSDTTRAVNASELLIIDIRNISATLDDAVWSFEQTYMPYLKGSGKANTRLWDGAIRLKFELRRRIAKIEVDPDSGRETATWEPVLCLNDRSCSIGGVELLIQGESRIAWMANKLTSLLGTKLRDYLVIVIINALTNNSARLIDMLNLNLCNYWDFIMRTAKLELGGLPELEEHHVTKASVDKNEDLVELVWRERVPLGLNILTNDNSGMLKVIDLPRGTQARQVAQAKQMDPDLFKGATIISVNGRRYGPDSQVELFAALKDPARPKAVLFKLTKSQNDLERIDNIIRRKDALSDSSAIREEKLNMQQGGVLELVTTVTFVDEGDIGLRLTGHDNFALSVSVFLRDSRGGALPVEKTGKVVIGDLLSHINDTLVLGANGEGRRKALSLLEQVGSRRPLSLGFVKPFHYSIVVEKDESENESFGGPSELVLDESDEVNATTNSKEKKIILIGFALTEGAAETGGVLVGDNLVFINGFPVGAGCRLVSNCGKPPSLDDVIRMLKQYSPLALGFARAQAKQSSMVKTYLTSSPLSLDIEAASTFSLVSSDHSRLGCRFVTGMNGTDIVVKDIMGVEGPFQRQMRESKQPFVGCKLESVDGEVVPSYVNSQLIINAMKRRWAANGRVEIVFCDDRQKDALRDIMLSDGT